VAPASQPPPPPRLPPPRLQPLAQAVKAFPVYEDLPDGACFTRTATMAKMANGGAIVAGGRRTARLTGTGITKTLEVRKRLEH